MAFDERTVIVLDLGNYKKEFQEPVPFKAICIDTSYSGMMMVVSLETNMQYELYDNQVLENLDIEDIKKLINLNNYGT
jgi:hypothetical protein